MAMVNQNYTIHADTCQVQVIDCPTNDHEKINHPDRVSNFKGKYENKVKQFLKIYDQNICGLQCKIDELVASLYPNLLHIVSLNIT
jgi:hypothetical protein